MAVLFDVSKEIIPIIGASQGLGRQFERAVRAWRVGAESDLDGAIMLLASSASRYMTGSVITVDGGFLLT